MRYRPKFKVGQFVRRDHVAGCGTVRGKIRSIHLVGACFIITLEDGNYGAEHLFSLDSAKTGVRR